MTEVPSPIDEIHHLAYVESLATGNGIPLVGTDLLPEPMLALMRNSPTLGYRRHALDPARPEEWAEAAFQYEGVQPPLYYALMVPAYLAGSAWGVAGSLYAVRIATLLVALGAIPVAWLLARALFPARPEVWAASGLLPAFVQGFNANLASVTNDALVVPLAGLALLSIVRGVRRLTLRSAAAAGAAIGLAMLAKLNAVALLPLLGLALLAMPGESRPPLARRLAWGTAAGAVAAVLASLWFGWNAAAYGSPNGSSAATARLLSPLNVSYALSLDGALGHFKEATRGFWQFERFSPAGPGRYGAVFGAAILVGAAAWLVRLARRRDRQAAGRAVWLAACWPVTFAAMLAIVYVAYTSTVVGRHTYPALAGLLVFLAAGLSLGLGRRLGALALACTLAAALWLEQAEIGRYVDRVYLPHLYVEGVAPVWEQPRNDFVVTTAGLTVRSSCPVHWIGLGFAGPAPAQVSVATAGRVVTAPRLGENQEFAFYGLARPAAEFEVRFDPSLEMGANGSAPGPVRFAGGAEQSSPMAQLQCRGGPGREELFSSRFDPYHWDGVSYGAIRLWGKAWAGAGLLLAAAAVAAALRRSRPA